MNGCNVEAKSELRLALVGYLEKLDPPNRLQRSGHSPRATTGREEKVGLENRLPDSGHSSQTAMG